MLLDHLDKLGIMGWPLVLCSVLALTVSLERLFYTMGARIRRQQRLQQLFAVLEAHRDVSKALRDEAVSMALDGVARRAVSGLKFLRIVATLSPLLGLLGTIFGIIAAFRIIAVHSGPVSPTMIADGLWEALLTTAFGLLIALPTLFAAYLFQALADRQLAGFAAELNDRSLAIEAARQRTHGQDDTGIRRNSGRAA
jgi:biopolymer transport protein ExbB